MTLWNLNFEDEIIGEVSLNGNPLIKEFVKGNGEKVVKVTSKFSKEFVKAGQQIYKLISKNLQICVEQMRVNMGLSTYQVQNYLKAAPRIR